MLADPRAASGAELVSVRAVVTPLGDEDSQLSARAAVSSARRAQAGAFPRVRKKVDSFRLEVSLGYSDATYAAVTAFNDTVTVSFTYRDDEINYWGVLEGSLKVMFSDDGGSTWSDLPTTIDSANKQVTAETQAPGLFALTGVRYRTTFIVAPRNAVLGAP